MCFDDTCISCDAKYDLVGAGYRALCLACQVKETTHEQLRSDFGFFVDGNMLSLVNALNRADILTSNSCECEDPDMPNTWKEVFKPGTDVVVNMLLSDFVGYVEQFILHRGVPSPWELEAMFYRCGKFTLRWDDTPTLQLHLHVPQWLADDILESNDEWISTFAPDADGCPLERFKQALLKANIYPINIRTHERRADEIVNCKEAWIQFHAASDATEFMKVCRWRDKGLYQRMRNDSWARWSLCCSEDKFCARVNLRFPAQDLEEVTVRLQPVLAPYRQTSDPTRV